MYPASLRFVICARIPKKDAEEIVQDTALDFWRYLDSRSAHQAFDPQPHERLWWRILRQRAARWFRNGARQVAATCPLEIANEINWLGNRQPSPEDALWQRDLERGARRFLREGMRRQGAKLLRTLVALARQETGTLHDAIELVEAHLFGTGERIWSAHELAAAAGIEPGAVYTNALRLRAWWSAVKRQAYAPPASFV